MMNKKINAQMSVVIDVRAAEKICLAYALHNRLWHHSMSLLEIRQYFLQGMFGTRRHLAWNIGVISACSR